VLADREREARARSHAQALRGEAARHHRRVTRAPSFFARLRRPANTTPQRREARAPDAA
jgi:hypothetical protein